MDLKTEIKGIIKDELKDDKRPKTDYRKLVKDEREGVYEKKITKFSF